MACLENILLSLEPNSAVIVLGDFNLDVMNTSHSFVQVMADKFHLCQLIDEPSTIHGTLIDLVFTNIPTVTAGILCNTWSDHHTLMASVPITCATPGKVH